MIFTKPAHRGISAPLPPAVIAFQDALDDPNGVPNGAVLTNRTPVGVGRYGTNGQYSDLQYTFSGSYGYISITSAGTRAIELISNSGTAWSNKVGISFAVTFPASVSNMRFKWHVGMPSGLYTNRKRVLLFGQTTGTDRNWQWWIQTADAGGNETTRLSGTHDTQRIRVRFEVNFISTSEVSVALADTTGGIIIPKQVLAYDSSGRGSRVVLEMRTIASNDIRVRKNYDLDVLQIDDQMTL